MTDKELKAYLQTSYPAENESCEWKEFKNLKNAVSGAKGDDIISYVSALANMEGGHLIIGVKDKSLEVVGIQEFGDYTADNIRLRILGKCPNLDSEGFQVEARATETTKTVWVFHIPKHQPRLPVYAHDKAWQRIHDSLVEMRPERLAAILAESIEVVDWSAQVVAGAQLSDLNPAALAMARTKFKEKNQNSSFARDIDGWDDLTLLDKAKVTIQGQMTRAALLLLGNPESSHFLLPHPAQITWKLESEEKDYRHFGPPFLLETTGVLQCIRNTKHKIFPDNQLLATEVSKYDTRVILEGLHNCIAHQDYTRNARILVTERIDRLLFENDGSFFEGQPEDYFTGERTPRTYRNPWLAQAMVNLNMIDTMGHGIHSMILAQRRRYFPLPDFGQSKPGKVALEVYGHVIDENYSKLLLERQDLELAKVILLDRVQKRQPITDEAAAMLRKVNLIEGRKPNYFVSAKIAEATGRGGDYIRNRAFDDAHYKEMILAYLTKFGSANRNDLAELILDKLSDVLDKKQRENKFRNLLHAMSAKDKTIVKSGGKQKGRWVIAKLNKDKL